MKETILQSRLRLLENELRLQMQMKKLLRNKEYIEDLKNRIQTIRSWMKTSKEKVVVKHVEEDWRPEYLRMFKEYLVEAKADPAKGILFPVRTTQEVDVIYHLLRNPENQIPMAWPRAIIHYYQTKIQNEIKHRKFSKADISRITAAQQLRAESAKLHRGNSTVGEDAAGEPEL